MTDFFGSIWWFIVALGLLVSFHEFGHFWVARRAGVKVLRFSVGFGKPLWRRVGRGGTEYVIAAIPLGGYVKMLDEREEPVSAAERESAFNNKSLGARAAIVAAGPIFNLVFTLVAFWLMFMVGVPELRAMFDEPTGISAEAGIEKGDLVTSVEGEATETLTGFSIALLPHAIDRQSVSIGVEQPDGSEKRLTLPLDRLGPDFSEENLLREIGFDLWRPRFEARVGAVMEDYPAAEAGFEAGDLVVSINGNAINGWQELGQTIQAEAASGGPLAVTIVRDGESIDLSVTPRAESPEGPFVMGVRPPEPTDEQRAMFERSRVNMQFGPLEAVGRSLGETWRMTEATLGLLRRMVTGDASVRNLSGPISIAQFANDSAQGGFSQFLRFLAFLSLSLAILNFLPIPLLDGGHLLYYLLEWIKGSPVSEQTQIVGQYIGLFALASLISLTFYNDILRLLS